MAFNAKRYGEFMGGLVSEMREMERQQKTDGAPVKIALFWPGAIKELSATINKVAANLLDRLTPEERFALENGQLVPEEIQKVNELANRLIVFPSTLSYEFVAEGQIVIKSTDRFLERALHYGTRQLPIVQPVETLARFLTRALADMPVIIHAVPFEQEVGKP